MEGEFIVYVGGFGSFFLELGKVRSFFYFESFWCIGRNNLMKGKECVKEGKRWKKDLWERKGDRVKRGW